MGADFMVRVLTECKRVNVKSRYENLVRECQYSYGHGGYTGTFAESPGITILDIEVDSVSAAEEYLSEKCEKWENTLAVRVKGSDTWLLGGVFSC